MKIFGITRQPSIICCSFLVFPLPKVFTNAPFHYLTYRVSSFKWQMIFSNSSLWFQLSPSWSAKKQKTFKS